MVSQHIPSNHYNVLRRFKVHSRGGFASSKIKLGVLISVFIVLAGLFVGCGLLGRLHIFWILV